MSKNCQNCSFCRMMDIDMQRERCIDKCFKYWIPKPGKDEGKDKAGDPHETLPKP